MVPTTFDQQDVHAHLRRHMHKVAGGGIAWERRLFLKDANPDQLLDAAVDIAWERLSTNALERPTLDITRYGNLIVFRVRRANIHHLLQPLPMAA